MTALTTEGTLTGGSAINGANGSHDTNELLALLLDKVDRMERKMARIEELVDQAPALIATVTDTVDGLYAEARLAGIDADERVKLGLGLLEKLTEPRTLAALEGLLANLPWIEQLAQQGPGMVAMAVDVADETYSAIQGQGVDLEDTVKTGLVAFRNFVQLLRSAEVQALLDSGVLDPATLRVIGNAASALVAARQSTERAGPVQLVGSIFDREVQDSLGFLLSFARNFGKGLPAIQEQPANQ